MEMFYFLAFYFTVFGIAVEVRVSSLLLDLCICIHTRTQTRRKSHTHFRSFESPFEVCSPWSIQIKRSYGSITHVSCMQIQNTHSKTLTAQAICLQKDDSRTPNGVISIFDFDFSTVARNNNSASYTATIYIMPSIKNLSAAYNAKIACYIAPSTDKWPNAICLLIGREKKNTHTYIYTPTTFPLFTRLNKFDEMHHEPKISIRHEWKSSRKKIYSGNDVIDRHKRRWKYYHF